LPPDTVSAAYPSSRAITSNLRVEPAFMANCGFLPSKYPSHDRTEPSGS
jgi:hypothetical protein